MFELLAIFGLASIGEKMDKTNELLEEIRDSRKEYDEMDYEWYPGCAHDFRKNKQ